MLAVFFAYMARFEFLKFGLKISFLIIFFFLALRYNFGNDYTGYLRDFIELNSLSKIDYFNIAYFHYEPGWLLLCRIFGKLGFFVMTSFLASLTCVVYYQFIKKYVPFRYYWLAIFLYIFTPSFLLIQASAMRQQFAVVIFIFSINYIHEKKPLKYFLCILIAYSFHSSALILLPFYFIGYLNKRISKAGMGIILSIFISLFLLMSIIGRYVNDLITSYFQRYETYQASGSVGTGLGIIYFSVFLFLVLLFEKYQTREMSIIFKIAIVSFIFIPLSLYIQLIARMIMYFGMATIIAYPVLAKNMNKSAYRTIFVSYIILITLYSFFNFFYSPLWRGSFGTYHSIFSAPQVY